MKKMLINVITASIVALFMSMQVYAADPSQSDCLDKALEQADEAVAHGKEGHADELLEHAKESLVHAQAASKAGEANTHAGHGIKYLEDAIKHAEEGNVKVATKDMEKAIEHLRDSEHKH